MSSITKTTTITFNVRPRRVPEPSEVVLALHRNDRVRCYIALAAEFGRLVCKRGGDEFGEELAEQLYGPITEPVYEAYLAGEDHMLKIMLLRTYRHGTYLAVYEWTTVKYGPRIVIALID